MTSDPWFVEAFRSDYLDIYKHRDEAQASREAAEVLSLMRFDPKRGRLLDLAAGAGRHAQAFRVMQCDVISLDLSEDLVRACAARGLPTVRADMRALPLREQSFAGVVMLFSSFGYFHEEHEHMATLREVARVLEPGGVALLDLMDPDTVRARLVPQDVQLHDGVTYEIERRMTRDGKRVEKSIRVLREGDDARGWTESVRLFRPEELSALAARVGLTVETACGELDGRSHHPGRTRQVVVLRRPRGAGF